MKRTFNYTGRRNIFHKDVSVTIRPDGKGWAFDAELRLADYRFPHNAQVWIEAHRQNLWMQWPWGSMSARHVPTDRRLSEFDVPDGVLFRVRVVHPLGLEHNKLLGEVDLIRPVKAGEADDHRRHLLEPVPDALDQQLWKLDFEKEPPVLLVNKDAQPTWKEMARSPQFIALVYPEVLRRILTKVLVDDDWSEDDEDEGWQGDWVRFARIGGGLGPVPPPDQQQKAAREGWIEEAVAAFARRMQSRATWDAAWELEGKR